MTSALGPIENGRSLPVGNCGASSKKRKSIGKKRGNIPPGQTVVSALNALLTDYGNCWGLLEKVAPQLLARLPHVDRDSIPTIDPTKYAQQMADVLGALLTDKKDVDAIDDESAYVSAVELWPERFSTYKKFTAWLGRHPEVANKSERQRLKIHAGQFITAWNAEVNRASIQIQQWLNPWLPASNDARQTSMLENLHVEYRESSPLLPCLLSDRARFLRFSCGFPAYLLP